MKKEIISAVTALTTAFAGMTATTAAADISDSMIYSPPSWGSITTNLSISEMEKLVSEYYGQSYKEWAIYGYSEVFDGVNVKVFKAENDFRGAVAAVFNGTSIYMTTENKTEIENFIKENYPAYNIDEEYNENGYNFRIWTYDQIGKNQVKNSVTHSKVWARLLSEQLRPVQRRLQIGPSVLQTCYGHLPFLPCGQQCIRYWNHQE